MDEDKEKLLQKIDNDGKQLVDFLCKFIRAKSPNPPGDTRDSANHVCDFLHEKGIPYKIIAPQESMPNIVSSFEGRSAGRHLVLNGHLDVFPVGEFEKWSFQPWGGELINGRIYGRGSVDMKCGTTASVFAFSYLYRMREELNGKLSLTCVSDEETFGPWGARYLIENHPEFLGDCCLNGEPSSPYTIRFGEKGILWLAFNIRTKGAHGAYPHMSESATKIAIKIISELENLGEISPSIPSDINDILSRNTKIIENALGRGASAVIRSVTVNIGKIQGGLKNNMIPSQCEFEADIRLPVGLHKEKILESVRSIVSKYPEASFTEKSYSPPNACSPNGKMVKYIKENVKRLTGIEPVPIISLGGTDVRLWRNRNIPGYVYGPSPTNMGSADEYVEMEEFLHIVKTHTLSAYDYLKEET
jgi:succinyl-diaminopimelate desuccinylase